MSEQPVNDPATPEGHRPRNVLVVANRTSTSPELLHALRTMASDRSCRFHVVVPATVFGAAFPSLAVAWDPLAGVPPITAVESLADTETARREAGERLEALLTELELLGAAADGEVGAADPLVAIGTALEEGPVDEIVLSTLPAGISRWLSRDLPSKCAKRFGVPVTHVEASKG